jgi:hypothetical protein
MNPVLDHTNNLLDAFADLARKEKADTRTPEQREADRKACADWAKRDLELRCKNAEPRMREHARLAVGRKISIRSDKRTRNEGKIATCEFKGWRNRGATLIAQWTVTLEGGSQKFVVESLPRC